VNDEKKQYFESKRKSADTDTSSNVPHSRELLWKSVLKRNKTK